LGRGETADNHIFLHSLPDALAQIKFGEWGVRTLQRFRYFQRACGLSEVPHFSLRGEVVPGIGISCFSCTAA